MEIHPVWSFDAWVGRLIDFFGTDPLRRLSRVTVPRAESRLEGETLAEAPKKAVQAKQKAAPAAKKKAVAAKKKAATAKKKAVAAKQKAATAKKKAAPTKKKAATAKKAVRKKAAASVKKRVAPETLIEEAAERAMANGVEGPSVTTPQAAADLDATDSKILDALDALGGAGMRDLLTETGESRYVLSQRLKKLSAAGVVRRVGGGLTTHYERTGKK